MVTFFDPEINALSIDKASIQKLIQHFKEAGINITKENIDPKIPVSVRFEGALLPEQLRELANMGNWKGVLESEEKDHWTMIYSKLEVKD